MRLIQPHRLLFQDGSYEFWRAVSNVGAYSWVFRVLAGRPPLDRVMNGTLFPGFSLESVDYGSVRPATKRDIAGWLRIHAEDTPTDWPVPKRRYLHFHIKRVDWEGFVLTDGKGTVVRMQESKGTRWRKPDRLFDRVRLACNNS